jgi:hypothetical protein
VVGHVLGDLDLLGNSVTACDSGFARSQSDTIDTLATSSRVRLESVAGEPVRSPTSRIGAVWVNAAVLSGNVGAIKRARFKACFGGLFLCLSRDVTRCKKLVDKLLVLADTVGEHASVVTIVVHAPFPATCQNASLVRKFDRRVLHIDDLTWAVSRYGRGSPNGARRVVISADARIVTTWTAASD